jgi:pimeloyl-ACP methyl ester carboxylesterase
VKTIPARNGFAEVNGTRLYYEAAGEGQALVLIHGFALDTRVWDDQFDVFAQQYRVIRLDLRGYGRSALPAAENYRHVDDLKALLDYLDLQLGLPGATLIGLSMGGGVAIDYALTYPETVRALVLVDSTLGGFRWAINWSVKAREVGLESARKRWLAHPIFAASFEQPEVAARIAQIVEDYSGWHWLNRDPDRGMATAIERLTEIHVPALVIVGERDLPDFQAIADILVQGIPRAHKKVLRGSGHLPNMESPLAFNDCVLNFLATL